MLNKRKFLGCLLQSTTALWLWSAKPHVAMAAKVLENLEEDFIIVDGWVLLKSDLERSHDR